jgi:hypothetical protein
MSARPNPLAELLGQLYDGVDRRSIDLVLADIDRLSAWIGSDWPSWARSVVDMLEASDVGAGARGSGVSDPTLGAVIRREPHLTRRNEVLDALEAAREALTTAQEKMGETTRTARAEELAKELRRSQCSGGMGLRGGLEWGDPTCQRLAVQKGLCRKHLDLHRAYERALTFERYS